MEILFKIIIGILLFYIYASVLIYSYALYKKRDLNHKPIFGIRFFNNTFFGIGCFIGIFLFFMTGFEKALFFIPENWGHLNQDDSWESTKSLFSSIPACLITLGLSMKYGK